MKFSLVIILLMAALQFVPPQFIGTEYFDNSYYTILYTLLAVMALALPFLVESLPKYIKRAFMVFSAWYLSALIFEVLNWFTPDIIINSDSDTSNFVRYSIMFTVAISLIIINESWRKKSHPNT